MQNKDLSKMPFGTIRELMKIDERSANLVTVIQVLDR
jgi:hypothetical protein